MKCLVCQLSDVGSEDSFDICTVCGRENESYGMNDDEFGGANFFTIKDHRELWKLNGAKAWNISGAAKLDNLAGYIMDELGLNVPELPVRDYQKIFEECKRLISQPGFDIDAELKRRAKLAERLR